MGIEPTWNFVEPHAGFEDHDLHQTGNHLQINDLQPTLTPTGRKPTNNSITKFLKVAQKLLGQLAHMKTLRPNLIKIDNGIYRLDLRSKNFDTVRQIVANGRKTLEFSTRVAAEMKATEIEKLLSEFGTKKLETAEAVFRIDPMALQAKLEPYGKTIAEAVDFYVSHLARQLEIQRTATLGALMDKWLEEKKRRVDQGTLRYDTYDTLYYKANGAGGYKATWGERPVSSITTKEIREWLENKTSRISKNCVVPASQVSKIHHLSYLSQFFIWAKRNHGVPENNPCELITIERNETAGEVEYFSVDEAQRIMNLSATKRFMSLVPYHAICLFSGVRAAECERLTWDNIDFENRSIVIRKTDAKTFARRVEIQPNLFAWLKWFHDTYPQYPLIPAKGFDDKKRQFRKNIGFVWAKNGMRHSAASYTLGAKLGDFGYLEQNFGNSRQMLQAHYLNWPSKEESVAFWNIKPN